MARIPHPGSGHFCGWCFMFSGLTLGQYFPGDSFLHRLDPRIKLVLLLTLVISLFALPTPVTYTMMAALVLSLALSSRISLKMLWRSVKPLLWLLAFTFIIHLFSTDGQEIARFWHFTATVEGAERGAAISLRLVLLLALSSLLTFTTSPLALTYAIEALLTPLKRFKVPTSELALMMTITLRFVPTLIGETEKIVKAQKSRGASFDSGPWIGRLQNVVSVIVPLFVSAFRRADELALAMEARCYRGGEGRTHAFVEMKLKACDYLSALAVVILLAGLLLHQKGWLT